MKKLLGAFKKLPPEVRMMLAMAGLGTPFGLVFFLKRYLFPGMSTIKVVLIVGAIIVGLLLVAFIVSRLMGLGARKRQRRMADDLAGGGGPGGMDVSAAIKANNEKFFKATRSMRDQTGLSVYDLPWYIVIGDSGCGKTKLINEGGLTFSTGKPEGYQLGTLNYNWWFTEDAVFIDMAGRLCNPQDDHDRREWEAFLGTIAKGRKGFPINGAVVCVSADHLLQDSPEKVEQDANTTLERLRDLQSRLGVTFATYLVVTKCDKILGFMQFFDRAERDITYKNQIFGWSKPGSFSELYEPDQFPEDFEKVYQRLNDLRLRRLQDDADQADLGLAYGFPEEFRELLVPLHTYVRTLFPAIRASRAIKNLIFRGAYFTSATQEGALILKHLSERLGADAAGQFEPLDLYPNKRPHFIKDVLMRKVFPEHGLVFRNEQQAVRNKKLGNILKWGSAAMFVLLAVLLGVSSYKFGSVIGEPRAHAIAAQPDQERTPADTLKVAHQLGTDIESLRAHLGWATILSWGYDRDRPIEDMTSIRAGLFEQVLLREALTDVDEALRTKSLLDPRAGEDARREAQAYLDALEQYVAWFGCAQETSLPDAASYEGFETLCNVVSDKESVIRAHQDQFFTEAAMYFSAMKGQDDGENPARLLTRLGFDPGKTIATAMQTAHRYLSGFAKLDDTHPDPHIREWLRVQTQCAVIEQSYKDMLDAANADLQTIEELQAFRTSFIQHYEAFDAAVKACRWQGKARGVHVLIDPLRESLLEQRKVWTTYQGRLIEAYATCGGKLDEDVERAIGSLVGGSDAAGLPGVDRVLWGELQRVGLVDRAYAETYFASFDDLFKEVPVRYEHILQLTRGGGATDDQILPAEQVRVVGGVLKEIHDRLKAARFVASDAPGGLGDWAEELESLLDTELPESTLDLGELADVWRADDLTELHDVHLDLIALGEGRRLLLTIHEELGNVGGWGVAELAEGWNEKMPSLYQIAVPRLETADRPVKEKDKEDKKPQRRKRRPRRGRRGRAEATPEPATQVSAVIQRDRVVPACATREFLSARAEECSNLLYSLKDFNEDFYFASDEDVRPLNQLCTVRLEEAGVAYFSKYVSSWAEAYEQKRLPELERLIDRATDWETLLTLLQARGDRGATGINEVIDEAQAALAEVYEAVPFWAWYFDEDAGVWSMSVDPDDREWAEVASWMQQALSQHWPGSLGRFVSAARPAVSDDDEITPGTAPWDALSQALAHRSRKLAKALMAQGTLPREFGADTQRTYSADMPWGRVQSLRREARVDDERLSAQLVAFEEKTQRLLSAALTEVLVDVQIRHLRDLEPFDGWPYLNASGDGIKALDTVDFTDFKRFVREIELAWSVFEPIEQAMPPDDAHLGARLTFYRACRDWARFMRLDEQLVPDELVVEIQGADPVTEPFGKERMHDTAQHYYDAVALDIGLAISRDDVPGSDSDLPLRMPTLTEQKIQKRRATWRWTSRAGRTELTVALIEGRTRAGVAGAYPTISHTLGQSSPLALCAYLHRHGVRYGDQWVTSHAFDLVTEFKRKGQGNLVGTLDPDKRIVGEKFMIKLVDRPLPEPILKLGRP